MQLQLRGQRARLRLGFAHARHARPDFSRGQKRGVCGKERRFPASTRGGSGRLRRHNAPGALNNRAKARNHAAKARNDVAKARNNAAKALNNAEKARNNVAKARNNAAKARNNSAKARNNSTEADEC
jgi:hypothetical protein